MNYIYLLLLGSILGDTIVQSPYEDIPDAVINPEMVKELSPDLLDRLDNVEDIIRDDEQVSLFKNYGKVLIPVPPQKCCAQIEMGVRGTHYAWNSNHYMVNGAVGHRFVTYWVPFPNPFANIPDISIALKSLDTWKDANMRVDTTVIFKHTHGFLLRIHTWANSKLYRAVVSYVARAYN